MAAHYYIPVCQRTGTIGSRSFGQGSFRTKAMIAHYLTSRAGNDLEPAGHSALLVQGGAFHARAERLALPPPQGAIQLQEGMHMLKVLGGTLGIIFLIGLLVVIGLFALIF